MESPDFSLELIKLGERIKKVRKHRNLTLLELETLSGINDSDLSRYEQGKENLEFLTIYKIAKALEVDVHVLTDYEGPLPENDIFKGLGEKGTGPLKKKMVSKRTPKK